MDNIPCGDGIDSMRGWNGVHSGVEFIPCPHGLILKTAERGTPVLSLISARLQILKRKAFENFFQKEGPVKRRLCLLSASLI